MGPQYVSQAKPSPETRPATEDRAPFARAAGQAEASHRAAAPSSTATIERASTLGHRFPSTPASTRASAPIQRWPDWLTKPLSGVAGYLGLNSEKPNEDPTDVRPGRYRYREESGKIHKPLKTKDRDKLLGAPLIEGSGQTGPQEDTGPSPHKLNWMDFSKSGVKDEQFVQGPQGKPDVGPKSKLDYDVKALHRTYERSPLVGYGIDQSYTAGPRENLSASLVNANVKGEHELVKDTLKASGKGSAQLGSVEAGLEAGGRGTLDWGNSRVDARVGGTLGAYAGQVGGDLTGGFKIPWTNVMISGGVTGKAAAGLGVAGEASLSANRDEGLRAGLYGSLVSGLGFGAGLTFGVGKYDSKKDWWGNPVKQKSEEDELPV
jgi:hypothetical protein